MEVAILGSADSVERDSADFSDSIRVARQKDWIWLLLQAFIELVNVLDH